MENEKTFLEFLQWEEENARQYYEEELAKEKAAGYANALLSMSREYWAGYADAVSNALAAYAGPTDITETMKGN